ncbi:MAG: DUF565 domain-containing protein [Okeania sp. SIO2D1]|nr:DUF565 domain-containing protein [Okeania sp. SIO2D1]
MQNTRFNNLLSSVTNQVTGFLGNPWRRMALILIGFLFGFFLGSAITSTAGQTADWDVITAAFTLLFTEVISRIVYGSKSRKQEGTNFPRSLLLDSLNALKIGVTYGLFVEAFKLNS